jgi:hypothetical protein
MCWALNLEHLHSRGVFYWLASWWQGWRSTWNGLLGAWRLQIQTNFRDHRGYGVEVRWGRSPQVLAGV